ncbi:MAG: alpha-L-fucosidase [Phycisphaerales bacterium]
MLSIAAVVAALSALPAPQTPPAAKPPTAPVESQADRDQRMHWWRDARFGMFIHWGLYAVAAGEWNGKPVPGAGEWILYNGKIKPEDYEPLQKQFNPVKFNAKQWVEIAKNAGMRYIVITSKHHDGFCLWDTKLTDWDVMDTPFHRDILKELSAACEEAGIRLCFYHSIMDWHHPDYLPRRAWDTRPTDKADFNRYREYMKGELKELLSGNYGDVGVLWFDGEWESTWNHEFGKDLDDYVRSLKPDIIVNNRVDVGRDGMAGLTRDDPDRFRGDFGTPEQEIPATGFPGKDWETCMTMNGTWGFHKHDTNWKSSDTLIQMLCDIASKGGNFLLNVGPTAEGEIPPASVERLAAMGAWLKKNGESIYGTSASVFPKLDWGRSTTKSVANGTKLYFQVFDWPKDGTLTIPGILNEPTSATLLTTGAALKAERSGADIVVHVPSVAPDPVASVVAIEVAGTPKIVQPAELRPAGGIFVNAVQVTPAPTAEGVVVRYTTDGAEPTKDSPVLTAIAARRTTTVKARAFVGDVPVGPVVTQKYERVEPWQSVRRDTGNKLGTGIEWAVIDGDFNSVDDLAKLVPEELPIDPPHGFGLPKDKKDHFGLYFRGYVSVPTEGLWRFRLGSDDGSRLAIDGHVIIDNDGPHSFTTKEGVAPLMVGVHRVEVWYFERDGQESLSLEWQPPNAAWQTVRTPTFLKAPPPGTPSIPRAKKSE